jgi:lipid II:glycine glycyltransferase (peptidoglycan interpeptide bridge formation enzyme)
MVFAHGNRCWYLYGASSNEERQRMPNHALQWAAINWARDSGCLSYDLWGVPDEAPALEAEPENLKLYLNDPPPGSLWGVYRFKRGFGGQTVRYIGAYDRVYSPPLHWLYEKVVNRRRGLST